MGLFETLKFYLITFEVTFLAHANPRLLLVGQKNSVSGNNGTLMLILTKIFGKKLSHYKDLIYLGQDSTVGGKDLKLGKN